MYLLWFFQHGTRVVNSYLLKHNRNKLWRPRKLDHPVVVQERVPPPPHSPPPLSRKGGASENGRWKKVHSHSQDELERGALTASAATASHLPPWKENKGSTLTLPPLLLLASFKRTHGVLSRKKGDARMGVVAVAKQKMGCIVLPLPNKCFRPPFHFGETIHFHFGLKENLPTLVLLLLYGCRGLFSRYQLFSPLLFSLHSPL